MENIKQTLIEKIAVIKEEIAELGIDREAAKAVLAAAPSTKDIDAWMDYCEANQDAMKAHFMYDTLDSYEKVLDLPLAKVTTRYVITDGELLSPAGYHPVTGIFIKNDVWIETDRLPQSLSGLKAYDVQKEMEAA